MTHKSLTDILTKLGDARHTGGRFEIAPSVELTLFVSFSDEGLVVDRVRSVELEADYAVAKTSRGDRFVVLYEDVRAIRLGASAGSAAGYER